MKAVPPYAVSCMDVRISARVCMYGVCVSAHAYNVSLAAAYEPGRAEDRIMCVYVYVSLSFSLSLSLCVCTKNTQIHTHTHTCVCVCDHVCVFVCVYVYVYVCVCACVCTKNAYIHTYPITFNEADNIHITGN